MTYESDLLTKEKKVKGNDGSSTPNSTASCYEKYQNGENKSNDIPCQSESQNEGCAIVQLGAICHQNHMLPVLVPDEPTSHAADIFKSLASRVSYGGRSVTVGFLEANALSVTTVCSTASSLVIPLDRGSSLLCDLPPESCEMCQ